MENKFDKMAEDITDIKITLTKNTAILEANTASLVHHIKRTDLNEERIAKLENTSSLAKGIWYAMCGTGAIILGLHALGILQKLF